MNLIRVTRAERFFGISFIVALSLFWIFPVIVTIKNSLQVDGLNNYVYIFTHKIAGLSIFRSFFNSLIVAVGDTTIILVVGTLAAFAFSKMVFIGRQKIYSIILMCLAIPAIVAVIPFFFILKKLHLYNTLGAVIIAEVAMTVPFAVLMMRNFFDNIPDELMESALIDGATKFQTFRRIYLPLSVPALINLGVLCIMWSFQDYLFPTMFLTNGSLTTATMAVNSFQGAFSFNPIDQGRFYASLVVLGMPAFIIFLFAQRYIANGITSGALKD
ncbi:carbohydrate ABC transporter permease [Cohnella endophytica]|uniref:Carbohydrate ABC transporter permease n=1 Tax=Cohnella endophytica TaxID=2419778 RepID=A0A494Y482_9BACL|nr:carbohydrate ABC transporter permease [Cohnella endophytica]RKP56275.1 carbohydrate ABC transporter permease [Cohnella endophytica]